MITLINLLIPAIVLDVQVSLKIILPKICKQISYNIIIVITMSSSKVFLALSTIQLDNATLIMIIGFQVPIVVIQENYSEIFP